MHNHTVGIILNQSQITERTVACLGIIARMVERGAHVRVFAHSHAVYHTIGNTPFAHTITELIRKTTVHGSLTWLIEEDAARDYTHKANHVQGVVYGSYTELWNIVASSDLVLTLGIDA